MSKPVVLINQLLQEYDTRPLFPVNQAMITQLLADENSASDSFKLYFQTDPIFSQQLIKAAWIASKNKTSHPFSPGHAMSLLGISQCKRLFTPRGKIQQTLSMEVKFALSASVLASELMRQLAAIYPISQQAQWNALCFYFPDTLLWYLQPRNMWRIYYRQLTLPKRLDLFEEAKLGFNLQQWRQQVAQKFHLNDQMQQLFSNPIPRDAKQIREFARHGMSSKTPSLKLWHKQEGWLIVVANRLARAILVPWHARGFQHEFALLNKSLNCEPMQLNQRITQSIRNVSEYLNNSDLLCPAVSHLMLFDKPKFPDWLVKPKFNTRKKINTERLSQTKTELSRLQMNSRAGNKVQQAAATIKTDSINTDSIKKASIKTTSAKILPDKIALVVKQLLVSATKLESSSKIIQHALTALIQEFGCSRVAFLVVDQKAKTAVTKISLCSKDSSKIRPDFQLTSSSPLHGFISKQSFLCFCQSQHKNIWGKLPIAIQQSKVKQFILCSLKPGKAVKALVYIDSQNAEVFHPKNLTMIKALLKALNQALALHSSMAKKANEKKVAQKKA